MKCIFCKQDSSESKSVEHIIPESMGNKSHVLPKGIVCDKCNNYFSLKIEKKVLEHDFFKSVRHRNGIESKKRKIPKGKVIIPATNKQATIERKLQNDKVSNVVTLDTESFELIKNGDVKEIILAFDIIPPENNQNVSRLLAKIAFEMFASKAVDNKEYIDYLINESQFDPIRNYVRNNAKNENWNYSVRKIYAENEKFYFPDGRSADMIFECDFLNTDQNEWYFIIAYKGFEFVINLGGESIDGYKHWLSENDNISPLYTKGKHFGSKLTPNFIKKKTKT